MLSVTNLNTTPERLLGTSCLTPTHMLAEKAELRYSSQSLLSSSSDYTHDGRNKMSSVASYQLSHAPSLYRRLITVTRQLLLIGFL